MEKEINEKSEDLDSGPFPHVVDNLGKNKYFLINF